MLSWILETALASQPPRFDELRSCVVSVFTVFILSERILFERIKFACIHNFVFVIRDSLFLFIVMIQLDQTKKLSEKNRFPREHLRPVFNRSSFVMLGERRRGGGRGVEKKKANKFEFGVVFSSYVGYPSCGTQRVHHNCCSFPFQSCLCISFHHHDVRHHDA